MKKNSFFRIRNTWQAVLSGIIAGIFSVIAVVCLLAVVLVKFDIPFEYVKYLWIVPSVLAGLISGGITGKHVKSKGFLWGCASASVVSIISISLLLFVNSFSVDLITFLIIPVFALSGSVGGIVAANLK